jgi:RNA polymerase primary sigma factor
MRSAHFHFPRHGEDIERYQSDLGSLPELSAEELRRLFEQAQLGDMDAREKLVLAHLRLVVRIACQYTGYGLPLADMISEGNIGLLRAVELFDPSHGVAFESYASVWIRQRIHRAITAQAKAVRIPVWRSQRLRKLDRLHEELSAELGRDATLQELAERLGMGEDELNSLKLDRPMVDSLDVLDETAHSVYLMEERDVPPVERLSREELEAEIYACLDTLDDHELQVLSLKFGLDDEKPASYRQMAPALGRNREWVRKVGERALEKVKLSWRTMGSIPRRLVELRRIQAQQRLKEVKKSRQSLSVSNTVLIPWVETLITTL